MQPRPWDPRLETGRTHTRIDALFAQAGSPIPVEVGAQIGSLRLRRKRFATTGGLHGAQRHGSQLTVDESWNPLARTFFPVCPARKPPRKEIVDEFASYA